MAHTQDHTPPRVIHYALGDLFAPGDRPLCGNESSTAIYSDDPRQVGWPAAETAWSCSPRT